MVMIVATVLAHESHIWPDGVPISRLPLQNGSVDWHNEPNSLTQVGKRGEEIVGNRQGGSKGRRIAVLVSGALNCFAVGTTYLYGVFQPYIMEYFGIDSAAATTPYTLVWMFMTIAQFLAGPLQKRFGVKATVCLGLFLMAAGNVGCSLLTPGMSGMLVFLYSVVLGLGLGIAYNSVAATVVRWFPDRKGLATSISIGMMGGAGVLLAPVFGSFLAEFGLQRSFLLMALIFVPCIVLSIAVFRDTPPGYMADYKPTGIVARQTSAHECKNLHDLLTTRDAWLLVLLYFSLVPTFLIASGVFVSFGVEAKQLTQETAVWFVSAGAIIQVIGRFVVPSLSDKIGRKAAFYVVTALMVVSAITIVQMSGIPYACAYCLMSFAYGGGVTAMPSIIADRLGSTNATQNIAFAEIGTLLGSVSSSILVNVAVTAPALMMSGVSSCVFGICALVFIYHVGNRTAE